MIEIPGYKIHREIDSSDYCRSYSAIQLSTGKTMVVSIFAHSATEYASFKPFFNDIEHKIANKAFGVITPIKEFIKTQKYTYIISDLLSNNCQQIYKERDTELEILFNHIYKIALSINLYHQVGFYHGGVALDNIFHDEQGHLTLGLPAFNQNFSNFAHNNKDNLDKESYQAPEQEISQSKSRDYYALGVVLYELVFKQKPFIASTKEELDQLKKAAVIAIPDSRYDNLKPVFSALLNPDPKKRIASADEFKHVAMMTGIHIENTSYSIQNLSKNTESPTPAALAEKPAALTLPKYAYVLALIITSGSIAYFFINPSPNETVQISDIDAEQLIEQLPESSGNLATHDTSEFNTLIKTASKELKDLELAASLITINHALKINPKSEDALAIKKSIELELKIKATIQQANQQILNGNIISPANNNAIATYQKLQHILPEGDTRAQQGIKKISDAYHRLAKKQYALKNTELAKSILAEGLSALPDAPQLKQLDQKFKKDEAEQIARLKREQQLIQERQQQINHQKNLEETQRIAALEQQKQREQEINRQQQRLKDFQAQKEKQRQQQISTLHQEAQQFLIDNQLSLQSINNAIDHLQSLEFLSVNPSISNQLRQQIDNAYVSLSKYQVSTKQYTLAQNTIKNGLKTNPQNQTLNTLNTSLNTLIAEQQAKTIKPAQEDKQLPIFGTF